MSKRIFSGSIIIALVATISSGSCARSQSDKPTTYNSVAAAPTPKVVTSDELTKLRWIEGTWRGTGDVDTPFYERYRFDNASTLVVEGLADEKADKVADVTRFELKDGQFGNGGDNSRWAATAIDDTSINFEPVAKARNSFRWQRVSDNEWKAILVWPANGNTPTRERVYRMERWPLK